MAPKADQELPLGEGGVAGGVAQNGTGGSEYIL